MKQTNEQPPGCVCAFFLLIGLIVTAVLGYGMVWVPLRVNLYCVETTCVVLDKRLEQIVGKNGPIFRPQIHIEYTVANRVHRTWTYYEPSSNFDAPKQPVLDSFQQGQRYPCWYDATTPEKAMLSRKVSRWSVMNLIPFCVPLCFVAFGIGGLINQRRSPPASRPARMPIEVVDKRALFRFRAVFFGGFVMTGAIVMTTLFMIATKNGPIWMLPLSGLLPFIVWVSFLIHFGRQLRLQLPSPERVASDELFSQGTAVRAQSVDDRTNATEEVDAWPTIPKGMTLEAGSQLTYRLNGSENAGCSLVLATFVNGIIGVFLFFAIRGLFNGNGNWIWSVVMTPVCICVFVTWGLGLIVNFVTLLMAGSVRFEISSHPLIVGTSSQYLVEQSGLFPVRDMQLKLKCTESATYAAGKNSRTESREVFQQTVEGSQDMEGRGLRGNLCVPDDIMHSFDSGHHKIGWELHVSGRVAGYLPYSNAFPVIVYPAGDFKV